MPSTETILFYLNIGLALCVITEAAACFNMMRKTACMSLAGMTSLILFGICLVCFAVQLVLFPLSVENALYAVYIATGVMYSGSLTFGVYCILLGKRSDKRALCVITGVLCIVPPAGTVMAVILLFRMRFDTRAESVIYNGYAYTFGALASYVGRYKIEPADASEYEVFPALGKREKREHLKSLKKAARDPEGYFKYGEAVAYYTPRYIKDAVKYIRKAANGNYAPALFNLGYLYETGVGVKKDDKKARELYASAAALGDKDVELRLAILALSENRKIEALEMFRKLADSGNVYAKFDCALCYEQGWGTAKDTEKALAAYIENSALYAVQERLFALAANEIIAEVRNEKVNVPFNGIASGEYTGDFALMIKGLSAVREKRAADAAALFLDAVKLRGKWEGVARVLVGTLYVDRGELPVDREHGAAYVISAQAQTRIAGDVIKALPVKLVSEANKNKNRVHITAGAEIKGKLI